MNLNWSNRVIKYILFVFNLIFVITGIIMIAVGVSVKAYYTDYDIFLSNKYFSLPNLLIATGSLIFFISFFGCCGAIRESWFMIFIFSILLALIFILEFSAGIAGYVLRDDTVSFLTEKLNETMYMYQFNGSAPNGETKLWDTIQYEFECCGANGPEDWAIVQKSKPSTTTPSSSSTPSLPPSSTQPPSPPPSSSPPTTPDNSTATPTTLAPTPKPDNKLSAEALVAAAAAPGDYFPLPVYCCKSNYGTTGSMICSLNDTSTSTYYTKGCVKGFGDYLKDHAVTLGGVGIGIALIQLFGVIFACHLTKQLKHGFYST